MTKLDNVRRVRESIIHAKRGVRYEFIPDLIEDAGVDMQFFIAIDDIHRLSTYNLSQQKKREILQRLLDWYERTVSEGL